MELISSICAVVAGIAMFVTPVLLVIFLIRWALGKPKTNIGIATAASAISFVVFVLIGTFTSPSTYCEHEYEIVEEIAATCTERGKVVKVCSLCEIENVERLDKLGHSMEEVSRVEPTTNVEGKIVIECIRCGKQEVESIDKLPKPTETEDPTETDAPTDSTDHVMKPSTGEISEVPDVDSGIVEVLMGAGYSVEHATEIQHILNMVGITSIEIYGMSGEAETGLNAMSCYANGSTERSSRFTVTTEDGVVFYVGFLDEDLYDTSKGGFLKKYSDVHIPETEVDRDTFYFLQEKAIIEVKSCLNYPSTADFDSFSWRIGRSDNNYKIIGKVSAKNGFGVKGDVHFSVWFVKDGDSFTVVGVAIDGQRVK